ncbi:MAG TPA: P1 family peptidase [Caldimonas sp.]|nr:P1 family peptidase [Caldimonas sp.]HEX4234262.1 P1 family peptidase [Caldimonas sp.]
MPFGLTAVAGLEVGHFTDARRPTGCTVVIARGGAVAGVDVRGASPGTRETELLAPINAIDKIHAITLAGGSAFGLDAASGVMRWLDERGIGATIAAPPGDAAPPPFVIPIVPAAILFDLWVGDARIRPDAAAGYAACDAASSGEIAEGNVGAGAGASVGKLFGIGRAMKGGIGTASIEVGGLTVAALVAVNAIGDVVDPRSGRIVAGARSEDGRALHDTMAALRRGELPARLDPHHAAGAATTLAVVATDAVLTKAEASKVAQMAHDGLARSIQPVHTMGDGDVVFALATGASGRSAATTLLGALAADVLAEAVVRAVRAARRIDGDGLPDLPAAVDLGTAPGDQTGEKPP